MSKPAPKRAGERVENHLVSDLPELEHRPDSVAMHYDAVTTQEVTTSREVPIEGAVSIPAGTLVEIKSVAAAITESSRAGRYYYRRTQHEFLAENGGVYLLAVCVPNPDREVVARKIVTPGVLEEHLGSWVDPDGRPDYAQLAWTNVFDPETVTR